MDEPRVRGAACSVVIAVADAVSTSVSVSSLPQRLVPNSDCGSSSFRALLHRSAQGAAPEDEPTGRGAARGVLVALSLFLIHQANGGVGVCGGIILRASGARASRRWPEPGAGGLARGDGWAAGVPKWTRRLGPGGGSSSRFVTAFSSSRGDWGPSLSHCCCQVAPLWPNSSDVYLRPNRKRSTLTR